MEQRRIQSSHRFTTYCGDTPYVAKLELPMDHGLG
jgi:hypothetical protein